MQINGILNKKLAIRFIQLINVISKQKKSMFPFNNSIYVPMYWIPQSNNFFNPYISSFVNPNFFPNYQSLNQNEPAPIR